MQSRQSPRPSDFNYPALKKLQDFFLIPIEKVIEEFVESNCSSQSDLNLYLRLNCATSNEKKTLSAWIKKYCQDLNILFIENTFALVNQKMEIPPLVATLLGLVYQYGLGVPQSVGASIDCYQKAAKENMTALCNILYMFSGIPSYYPDIGYSINEAYRYLEEALEEIEHARVQYALGYLYSRHHIYDTTKPILSYYKKSMELGYIHYIYNRIEQVVEMELMTGLSLDKDDPSFKDKLDEEVLRCYETGLAKGNVNLAFTLVGIYKSGREKVIDIEKAALIFRHYIYIEQTHFHSLHEIYLKDPENLTVCYHTTLAFAGNEREPEAFNACLLQLNKLAKEKFEDFIALCSQDSMESISTILFLVDQSLKEKIIIQFNLSRRILLQGDENIRRQPLPLDIISHEILPLLQMGQNLKQFLFTDPAWQKIVDDVIVGKKPATNMKRAILQSKCKWTPLIWGKAEEHTVKLKRKETGEKISIHVENQLAEIEKAEKGEIRYRDALPSLRK